MKEQNQIGKHDGQLANRKGKRDHMNDLERIGEIENILGFELNRVPLEKLTREKLFDAGWGEKGARNYSLDQNNRVDGLALDYAAVYSIPMELLTGFQNLQKLNKMFNLITYRFK